MKRYLKYFSPDGIEQPYLVNSFQSLGWQDPFPSEEDENYFDDMYCNSDSNIRFPTLDTIHEDVYPPYKYFEDTTPYLLYIPNK